MLKSSVTSKLEVVDAPLLIARGARWAAECPERSVVTQYHRNILRHIPIPPEHSFGAVTTGERPCVNQNCRESQAE